MTHIIFNDYPARMIPQIPRRLITLYYPKYTDKIDEKPILDPFSGSGTTGVESIIRNIDSIAFDLNPLACLITKVRTTIISEEKLDKAFLKFKKLVEKNKNNFYENYYPDDPNLNYWYSEEVLKKLSVVAHVIQNLFKHPNNGENEDFNKIKDLFELCLAKVARGCSYQRNGEHKSYRIPKNKISDFDKRVDPFKSYFEQLELYINAVKKLSNFYKSNEITAKNKVILGNSMQLADIKENSIDLIITSPPYGDSHTTVAYGQFSRFPLEWTQAKYDKIKNIDDKLLGGEKDYSTLESPLLLEISKEITREEFNQQNLILNDLIDKLKKQNVNFPSSENRILENIIEDINQISTFSNQIIKTASFNEFIKLRKQYYIQLKNIRKICLEVKNNFKSEKVRLDFLKFRTYDERLPFVLSFFSDLLQVLKRLFFVLDYDRKCCIVVGNRTVKRVRIPTDEIIIEIGKLIGFSHVTTYYRKIPNKRMPRKNSPTNIKGEKLSTMNEESIIILSKL